MSDPLARRLARCVVLALVALAVLASGTAYGAQVAVVNDRLVFAGSAAANDLVDVEPVGTFHQVYSGRERLESGPGCFNQSVSLVICPAAVVGVDVDARGGNDLIGLWDVTVPVRVNGGDGDDFLEGGRSADAIDGGRGDDGLVGGAGDDGLAGGVGDDVAFGGQGADTENGNAGDDVLGGDDGADIVLGGADRDLLRGGDGDDRLDGDRGEDAVVGGAGRDRIDGGQGEDDIFGVDDRRDRLRCGRGDRVEADPGERPPGCETLPDDVTAPSTWPPPPASAASVSAREARRRPPGRGRPVFVRVRRPGRATRTTICVRGRFRNVRIRVRTYSRQGRFLQGFDFKGPAKPCRSIGRPSPGRAAVYAKAFRIR